MTRLAIDQAEVHAHFLQGGFSVQIGSRNPFETVNNDTQKTPGGTKGFSLKSAAVTKYYMTSEYRSAYLRKLWGMVGQSDSHLNHPDLQLPRIRRDEADVQSLVELMDVCWLNLLRQDHSDVVSLSAATVAPPDIVADLLGAHRKRSISSFQTRTTRKKSSNNKVP